MNTLTRLSVICLFLLSGFASGFAVAQASDPRGTDLYKELKVHDPESFFIPPLSLRHVIQLPSPWSDPLAESQAMATGSIRDARLVDAGVEVTTENFLIRVTQEGEALHFIARSRSAPAADVYPSLSIKDKLPFTPLEMKEDGSRLTIRAVGSKRAGCVFNRADGSFDVPWGDPAEGRSDRYRVVYSRLDKRIYVLSPLPERDHIFGLGMKAGPQDRRGQRFIMWNSDSYGYHDDKDPLYASIPFFLRTTGEGKGGRGTFVDDSSDVVFDFGFTRPGELSFATVNGQADFYLFTAPRLAGVVSAYQALTGTSPLPPVWALGYHQSAHTYFPEQRVIELAQTFREKKIPCDALYLDIIHQDQYRPFTWNLVHFPEPRAMIEKLHGLGFRVLTIIDPGIQANEDYPVFNEARAGGFLLRTDDGRIYANNIWPGYSVFPDFLQAGCRDWWSRQHRFYLGQGVDAFKNDMSEPATFNKTWSMLRYDETTKMPTFLEEGTLDANVVSRSPELGVISHRFFHNAYGLYEAMATAKAQEAYDNRRPFVLMRNTFSSGQRYTSLWTGDIISDWPSLRHSIQLLLSLNLSGFPVCGADNGGFGGRCTPELFARWTEFSAFSPFFRTHYFYVEQCIAKEPWSFGAETEKIATDYIRLRYRLLPYLYTSLHQSLERREPLLKPLFFVHEDEPRAYASAQQYYWGDRFLVAPLTEPGARGRFVYLPRGEWYDFWTGLPVHSNGEDRYVESPLDKIPVFIQAGAIVPAMEPVAGTTGNFPPRQIILECYLDRQGAAGTLYLDDGATRQYSQGDWTECRFRLKRRDSRLELAIETAGRPNYLPERLTLQVRGAGSGIRTVRFGNRSYPVQKSGGLLEAMIPLR